MKKSLIFGFFLSLVVFFSYQGYRRFFFQPYLTIIGFIDLTDGIGRQSLELIDTFKNDVPVSFVPTRPSRLGDVSSSLKRLVKKDYKKLGKVIVFEDLLWWPGEQKYEKIIPPDAADSIKIAYSMVESSKIPDEWVLILNKHFDAVAVPDHFLVDVYQKSGVKIPIFELPLGLDLQPMLETPLKIKRHDPFVFGNLSACNERKNHLLLIRAFANAFGNDPKVQLRINSRTGEKEVTNKITAELEQLGQTNILFTQFRLDKKEYLNLFQEIDCYVNVSKGEGFSIQPREAMALGIPTIVTHNTAQSTICKSNLVKAVSCPKKELAIFPWGNYCGHFSDCTVEEVVKALKEVYEQYDTYLQKAAQARQWAMQYQYSHLKPFYQTLIRPKKIELGKENRLTPDCLITDSKALFDKYQKLK